jgi:acetyltransferase-like isoleucine patch superfamily enzyme
MEQIQTPIAPRLDDFNRIAPNVKLGEGVKLTAFINAYGCAIGDRTKIGTFVEIQKNATIGKDCKISSHTFVCEGVNIGDRVFIGHNVTFINDKLPRAANADGSMQTEADWNVEQTWVEDGASLGSSVTVLCGLRIGAGAIVGAGSVVTKSVPPGEIWAGNPAKYLKKVGVS